MGIDSRSQWSKRQGSAILKKLLGSLELEVMEFMWQAKEANVRQVAEAIGRNRPVAYTTIMTVMGHLVDKGLLTRTMEGKRYRYCIAQSRNEYLYQASRRMVRSLVDDFGDLAIAGFLGEIDRVDTDRLEQLKDLMEEVSDESSIPE